MSKSKLSKQEATNHIDESGHICYLSLGSNVGERRDFLRNAIDSLKNHEQIRVLKESSVYESQPLENTDQPFFLNMVLAIATDLEPQELLSTVKQMETDLGRQEREENGPREIDIDIVFYSDQEINTDGLTIPHPKHHQRKFVLVPLSHIAPDFVCPVHQLSVEYALKQSADDSYIHLLDPSL